MYWRETKWRFAFERRRSAFSLRLKVSVRRRSASVKRLECLY